MGRAFVIPADPGRACYPIDWPYTPGRLQDTGATLAILYREIGCDCVDATPRVRTRFGEFLGWSDDTSLLVAAPSINDRAIMAYTVFGMRLTYPLAGVIVLTGGPDVEGDTLPLPDPLLDRLIDIFGRVDAEIGAVDLREPTHDQKWSAIDAEFDEPMVPPLDPAVDPGCYGPEDS